MMNPMKCKSLSTAQIALSNLCGNPGKTIALIVIVSIMAFALFGGAVLSRSLDNGLNSLGARLGADIAVVPPGSERYYESIILTGAPIHFYFYSNIEEQIAYISGVEQVTTQFHLATLATSPCCTIGVHIIGIDYSTDFVVTSWIAELLERQIGDGEVVAGRDVVFERDGTAMFFGHDLNVIARLERTATGMDNAIFLNMNTAREIARSAQHFGHIPEDVDTNHASSAILIRVAQGYDILDVASRIRANFPTVGIVISQGIYSNISLSLRLITGAISAITIVLVILVVLLLTILFYLVANGRKKEFAILRILGAPRKKLTAIVLTEAVDISLCGAIIGSLVAAIVFFPFGSQIGLHMGVPLLLPNILDSLRFLALTMILSVGVGSLSSAYTALKISRAETYATMREGE